MQLVHHKAIGATHYHFPSLHLGFLSTIRTWIRKNEPVWEYYRLSIAATGIFIQVTIAAFMIAVLGAAGAPALIFTTGIFFAFASNAIASAQAPMRWVIFAFLASILVNLSLGVYYLIQLL